MKDTRTIKISHQTNLTSLFEAYTPRLRELVDLAWDSRQSAIALREDVKSWVLEGTPFTGHWKDSLCRQAVQVVKAGRAKGVKPEIKYDSIRLDVGLFRIKADQVDVTVNPKTHIRISVQDPRLAQYLDPTQGWKRGECTLTPRYVCLVFTREVAAASVKDVAGMDINFESIVVSIANETLRIDTAELARIKRDHHRERRKLQKCYAKKQARLKKVWAKQEHREKRRIRDRIHKASKVITDPSATLGTRFCAAQGSKIADWRFRIADWLAMESLSRAQPRDRPSLMNQSAIRNRQSTIKLIGYGLSSVKIDPRETSSLCPFCGAKVMHPDWHTSVCHTCGRQGDRDEWSALIIRQRGLSRLGGSLFTPNGSGSFLEDSQRLRHTRAITRGCMST